VASIALLLAAFPFVSNPIQGHTTDSAGTLSCVMSHLADVPESMNVTITKLPESAEVAWRELQIYEVLSLPIHDYPELHGGDVRDRVAPAFMVEHMNRTYFGYKGDLFRMFRYVSRPNITDFFEPERLNLPVQGIAPLRENDYNLRLFKVEGDLFLSLAHAQNATESPEDAHPTLFRVEADAGFIPVEGEPFLRSFDDGYRYVQAPWIAESGEYTVAHGPFESGRLYMTRSLGAPGWFVDTPWLSGVATEEFFLADRLVVIAAQNALGRFTVRRGMLGDARGAWEMPLHWPGAIERPDDPHEFPERISAIGRSDATGTMLMASRGRIVRSTDDGASGFVVAEWDRSSDVFGSAADPLVHFFAFPPLRPGYVVAAGQVSEDASRQAFVAWSGDDGQTWSVVSDMIPESDRADSPIILLGPDEHGYGVVLGRADREANRLEILHLAWMDPFVRVFPSSTVTANGWVSSPHMGSLYVDHYPWTWVKEQDAWIFVQESDTGFWGWDARLGWLWSRESMYPFFYSVRHGGYLFYDRSTRNPRRFYDYVTGEWFEG